MILMKLEDQKFLCSPGFALDPYIIKLTKITDFSMLEDKKPFFRILQRTL